MITHKSAVVHSSEKHTIRHEAMDWHTIDNIQESVARNKEGE